jgi:hypothetical protein
VVTIIGCYQCIDNDDDDDDGAADAAAAAPAAAATADDDNVQYRHGLKYVHPPTQAHMHTHTVQWPIPIAATIT